MRKFLVNIAVFALISGIIAIGLDYAISTGLQKRTDYVQEVWNDVKDPKIDPDLIVLGSCMALHDHNPRVIDSLLAVDSYVFAMSNLTFPYHNLMWEMLKKYKYIAHSPKLIILALDYSDLAYREAKSSMDNEQFLNLFWDKDARGFLLEHGGYNWCDAYIPCYRYYGHKKRIKYGLANFFGVKKYVGNRERYKGYFGLDSDYSFHREWYSSSYYQPIDNDVVDLLVSFLGDCSKRGIEVLIVCPPVCYELSDILENEDSIYGIYESLARKFDFNFVNFSAPHWMSMDTSYFESPPHLTRRMSEAYSYALANYVDSLQLLRH